MSKTEKTYRQYGADGFPRQKCYKNGPRSCVRIFRYGDNLAERKKEILKIKKKLLIYEKKYFLFKKILPLFPQWSQGRELDVPECCSCRLAGGCVYTRQFGSQVLSFRHFFASKTSLGLRQFY